MYDTNTPIVNDHFDAPATTNSRHVADMFGKSHKAVLSKIKELIYIEASFADEFLPASYTLSSGVFRVTSFNMTKSGFNSLMRISGLYGRKSRAIAQEFLDAFEEVRDTPHN